MNLIRLSLMYNNRYKKYSKGYLISLIFASILFLFFLSITSSVKNVFINIAEDNLLAKQITVSSFKEDENLNYFRRDIDKNIIDYISIDEKVQKTTVNYRMTTNETGLMKFHYNDLEVSIKRVIRGINTDYSTFSSVELIEIKDLYGHFDDPIVAGRDFKKGDTRTAIIDMNFVYVLGYKDVNKIIGDSISISKGDEKVENITIIGVSDYRLGSIPDKNFKELSEDLYSSYLEIGWDGPLIVSSDIIYEFTLENTNNRRQINGQYNVIFETKSINDVEEIFEKVSLFTDNSISSFVIENKEIVNRLENISKFTLVFALIILIISFISICNSNISKLYTQRKFLKMMYIMGYQKIDIIKVNLLDHILTFIKVAITYIILILFITVTIEFIISPHYKILTRNLNYAFLIKADIVVIYTLVIFFITSLITVIFSKNQVDKYIGEY